MISVRFFWITILLIVAIDTEIFAQTSPAPIDENAQTTPTFIKEALRETARERGTVRIIVTYRMEGFTNDFDLSEHERIQQRHSIEMMHDDFERYILAKRFRVHLGTKMVTNPRRALSVDEEGLEYLFESRYIARIEPSRSARNAVIRNR